MRRPKLTPCPKCDGEALSYISGSLSMTYFWVGCEPCNFGVTDPDEVKAMHGWNAAALQHQDTDNGK